ncbi:hypothetical protein [Nocardia sp. CNY236]|uniref:hypothetical protein n=1 Tax=Nocardia sp. CNY236 TaxID=1169152 RepID=UPI00048D30E2|nr:hypothetical protein [Nocardia sp. CNY236]
MTNEPTKPQAATVNPIVEAAADQVTKSRRRDRTRTLRDLPRWGCPDQLVLFDTPTPGAD